MRTPRQIIAKWAGAKPVDSASPQPAVGRSFGPTDLLDELPGQARIDRYGALLASDFMACETVKARAVRSLPVKVLKRNENGRVPADGHELTQVFHRPNALMSWGDLVSWAMIRRDVFGTAYIKAVRHPITGKVTELRPVLGSVAVSFDKAKGLAVYSAGPDDLNDGWTCREDDLVILKTDASEDGGRTGRSIVETAADDIGLSVDLVRFYRSVLENGNHFSGWLEVDDVLTKEDVDAVRQSLKSQAGPGHAGEMKIFDRGLKYNPVELQMKELNLVEQERFVLEKVCRACHVDMHHVYADDKSSATAATGADIDFVKNTVVPEVTAIEQAFQPMLDRAASLGGSDSGYRVKVDVNGLLRGDFKVRMEGYRIGVYSGIFTRAYCATQEDIPWLPGQDKLLQPTAYYILDAQGDVQIPAPETAGTQGQSDGVSGIDEKAVADRLRPVIADAQKRIEKRARADGDCGKTRDFADAVMSPIQMAAAQSGVFLLSGHFIDEAIERGTEND